MEKQKIIVGLSGGVDSSVAAYLLKAQGYDVIGVTMVHFRDEVSGRAEQELAADAARVAEFLKIPHFITDFCQPFKAEVIDYFTGEYLRGRTPNPCVVCNRSIKWKAMMEQGEKLGASLLSTGHYASVIQLPNGRYSLKCSVTSAKDQTYALYNLSQEQLSRTRMPLGNCTKEQVREIAGRVGIPVADKPDSMEICFIPDKDYARFIEEHVETVPPKGNYVDKNGKILGRHKGIIHYTIGQRKGLNLAMGHPVFVSEIRPDSNEVVIGENEDIFASALICDHLNAMSVPEFTAGMEVWAKIRYNHKGASAIIKEVSGDTLYVQFKEPQRAITPGQAVVFYENDHVVGGGIIKGAVKE